MDGRDARSILNFIRQDRPILPSWRDVAPESPDFARMMEEVERIQIKEAASESKYKLSGVLREVDSTRMPAAKRTLRFSTDSLPYEQNESINHRMTAAATSAVRAYEQMYSARRVPVAPTTSQSAADVAAGRRRFMVHSAAGSSPSEGESGIRPGRIRFMDDVMSHYSATSGAVVRKGGLQFDDHDETEGPVDEGEEHFRDAREDDEDDDEDDDGQVIGQVREEDFHVDYRRNRHRIYQDDQDQSVSYDEEEADEEQISDNSEMLDQQGMTSQEHSHAGDDDMDASERLARELMEAEQAELLERLHAEQQRALAQLRAAGAVPGEAQPWLNLSDEDTEEADEEEEEREMTYDELLELGERLGDVRTERWRQKSATVAANLPTVKYVNVRRMLPMYRDDLCIICQFSFEDVEEVKLMPNCTHSFHADCADQWIKDHDKCATCKAPIESAAEEE